jgi:hypothetical protein
MGAVKEAMFDCYEHGFVMVSTRSVEEWRKRLGPKNRAVLDGMPMTHYVESRSGEMIPTDVLPIEVARQVGRILPDTHDVLGWQIECFE